MFFFNYVAKHFESLKPLYKFLITGIIIITVRIGVDYTLVFEGVLTVLVYVHSLTQHAHCLGVHTLTGTAY